MGEPEPACEAEPDKLSVVELEALWVSEAVRAGLVVKLGVRSALGLLERLGEPVRLGVALVLRVPVPLLLFVSETVWDGLSVCDSDGLSA